LYGPTEASIEVSHWTCSAQDHLLYNSTPIGKPIGNIRLYVLDRYLCPVPIGVPGELYISGIGLARGYKNRPELNQEKFIPNPFVTKEDPSQNSYLRMYRTGDLVKRMSDGNIDFLGRIDFQIKLRGFRIELGEIEAVLANYPAIYQCAVVLQDNGRQRLVAYCVGKSDEKIEESALRGYLNSQLPEYMVPSIFVYLDSLPLNTSGKLDRKALPKPEEKPTTFVAPQTQQELLLASIWEKVLQKQKISIHDNFFSLGGDSLTAIEIVAKITTACNITIPIALFFQMATIFELAAYIALKNEEESEVEFEEF
jgi:acyl-CoA synthetase (AMP-forming)/AMP-acid ligase II/acyl carrier protein